MKCYYGLLVIPELPVANHLILDYLLSFPVFSFAGEEAWEVLPISLVSGVSLLANNTALLYGGVAFVSMVHANVTWRSRSKFEKGGLLERGERENHRQPCWFPPDFFFYSFLFEDLLFSQIFCICVFCIFCYVFLKVVVYCRLYLLEWNSQARSPHCGPPQTSMRD